MQSAQNAGRWAAVGLGAAVFLATGCHQEKRTAEAPTAKVDGQTIVFPADSKQQAALAVEPAAARKTCVSQMNGRLVWDEDVTVRVFSPVGGRVSSILALEGQKVEKDAVLARVASPEFWQAQADAARATSDLALAEKTLKRLRDLQEHGAAALKDVEAAEADFTQKTSEKERAMSLLALHGGQAGSTADRLYSLRSPLPGVVVERNITPGQEIRPDTMLANAPQLFTPLYVMSDPTRLWISKLKAGQKLRVYSQAYKDKAFDGEVELVGASLDPATRTVRARGRVNNPLGLLKAEMYVTVDIDEGSGGGVDISSKAVLTNLKDNERYVFVEESPGQYVRRAIKVGSEQNGRVSVQGGLAPGQKVVTDGCLLLQSMLEGGSNS
jgi:cobalt-zinc-cadmium efflux system membrane fusion protein